MVTTVILAVIAAVTVVSTNRHSPINQWLGAMLVVSIGWICVVNLTTPHGEEALNLWLVRMAFVGALLLSYTLVRFVAALTGAVPQSFIAWSTISVIALICLSSTHLVISEVITRGTVVAPTRNILYFIVIFYMAFQAVVALYLLYEYTRHLHGGALKTRAVLCLIGLTFGTVTSVLTNIILPNLMGDIGPARFAWVPLLVWTIMLVYAVVRYRFFDIRLAIVRTIGYFITLYVVGIFYIGLIGMLMRVLQGERTWQPEDILLTIVPVIGVLLVYAPLRVIFDRMTNRLFYRDNYDESDVYRHITHDLALTPDTTILMKRATQYLAEVFQAEHVAMYIFVEPHVTGFDSGHGALLADADVRLLMQQVDQNYWAVVDATNSPSVTTAGKLLAVHQYAMVLPLRQAGTSIGLLCMGIRKSRGYSDRDYSTLLTIADQLSVVAQNALFVEQIQHFNAHLRREVHAATRALRSTNQRLEELDEAKDEFVSMASHQLRTPLTSVKGYISMLLDGDGGKLTQVQQQLLTEAFYSSERMVRLISDFLNVSRLQTGKFMIDRSIVDLAQVLRQEVSMLRPAADVKQITLTVATSSRLPRVYVDEGKLRQVMMNFIDNALFYSHPGSSVAISLKLVTQEIIFTVSDPGIGVPKSEQKRLFTKFFRATNARRHRPDGTGIGLFLARKVIDEHGGSTIVKSVEGQGSTFGFRMSLAAVRLPESHLQDQKPPVT